MEINFAQITPVGPVLTFPDYAVFGTPLQPEQILETTFIQGSSVTGSALGGSVDTPQ